MVMSRQKMPELARERELDLEQEWEEEEDLDPGLEEMELWPQVKAMKRMTSAAATALVIAAKS